MNTRRPDSRLRPPGPHKPDQAVEEALASRHHHRLHDRHRADDRDDDQPPGGSRPCPSPR